MVILPMKIKGIILNLQISFQKIEKEENTLFAENNPNDQGEIQVNKINYFGKEISEIERARMEKTLKYHPEILTEFIRRNIQTEKDSIIVRSQVYKEKDFCTKYTVPQPPKKGNIALDKLYGKLLNDLRLNTKDRQHHTFLSFEKIGLKEKFMQEKEGIIREGIDVLEYFNQLRFDTIDDSLDQTVQKEIAIRPKNFSIYYQNMAQQNSKTYIKICRLHQQVYATQPSWPKLTEQQKVYIKATDSRKAI